MKLNGVLRTFVILVIVMCNISCDQISKTIVRQELGYNETHTFFNDHFTLTKVENTGAFLSLGNSLPYFIKFILLLLLPTVVLMAGIYFILIKKELPKGLIIGSCFVIGGGIGNLFDRFVYGSVTDFLHIDFVIFQTGIFNLADVSIMIGFFIIIIQSQFGKPEVKDELTIT